VGITEAVQTLQKKYDNRIETLQSYLEEAESRESETDNQLQEVWSLTGHAAIELRMLDLINEAESEIALLVVDENVLSETLFDSLDAAANRDLSIISTSQSRLVRTSAC